MPFQSRFLQKLEKKLDVSIFHQELVLQISMSDICKSVGPLTFQSLFNRGLQIPPVRDDLRKLAFLHTLAR